MSEWRSRFGGLRWTVTPHGVVIEGTDRPMRTRGEPKTMRLYWAMWGHLMLPISRETGVPLAILLMTVATENGPAVVDENELRVVPIRREPKYVSDKETPHQISVGPCHVLISTARDAMGNQAIDRAWLMDRGNNLLAAATYMRGQHRKTGFDPILAAASYNAGSLKRALPGESRLGNRWHLRSWGNHLDRAAAWYGDACAVIEEMHAVVRTDIAGMGRAS